MEIIRKTSLTVTETIKLLWHRLPYIALYSFSLAVIWIVANFAYTAWDKHNVEAAPVGSFVKYLNLTTPNIREGEDLTYTVCRDFRDSFKTTGKRNVYAIPEGKTVKDRTFLASESYEGNIEGSTCASYTITNPAYHLKPGRYQLSLTGDITVKYDLMKHYYIDGNIFIVREQPVGTDNLQAQINNLSAQLDELKQRFGVAATRTSVVQSNPQASPTPSISSKPTPSASPSVSPSATPTPRPCALSLLGLCVLGGL